MDCRMPIMDGYQTTEKIRQRNGTGRHIPIIAVTASAMASDRARCLESGMDNYLTKPLREELGRRSWWVRSAPISTLSGRSLIRPRAAARGGLWRRW
jgi:CheY-like chemotaxis protein